MPPGRPRKNQSEMIVSENSPNVTTRRQKTRNHLNLLEKIDVLTYFKETKCSVRKLALTFNIGKTQAGHIIKNEENLLNLLQFDNCYNKNVRLRPDSLGYKIDRIVHDWYLQNVPDMQITGTMIKDKALELAKEMGNVEFKASNGWLLRFLRRNQISLSSPMRKLRDNKMKLNNGAQEESPAFSGLEIESNVNEQAEVPDFSCVKVEYKCDEESESADVPYIKSELDHRESTDVSYIKNELDHVENTDLSHSGDFQKILTSILPKYSADDIYSAVQTGLFYKAVPNNTLELINESCSYGEFSTDRCTILFCSNMLGVKEKPLVVASVKEGNFAKLNKSDIDCLSQEKAWLTQDIITKWLEDMDCRMGNEGRRVLLFLNHSIPRTTFEPKNIEIFYFPPCFSYENEPVNQKIIQNFKILYRQHLLKHLIKLKDDDENVDDSIGEFEAIDWIINAWKEVSDCVIHTCFEELGFYSFVKNVCFSDNESFASLDDISNLLCAFDSDVRAIDYVSIDNDLVTEDNYVPVEVFVDTDTVKDFLSNDDEKMDTESQSELTIKSYDEALQTLEDLKKFYLSQNDENSELLVKQLISYNEMSAMVKKSDSKTFISEYEN